MRGMLFDINGGLGSFYLLDTNKKAVVELDSTLQEEMKIGKVYDLEPSKEGWELKMKEGD